MKKARANILKEQLKSFYRKRNLPFNKAEYKKAKRIYTSLSWKDKSKLTIV